MDYIKQYVQNRCNIIECRIANYKKWQPDREFMYIYMSDQIFMDMMRSTMIVNELKFRGYDVDVRVSVFNCEVELKIKVK